MCPHIGNPGVGWMTLIPPLGGWLSGLLAARVTEDEVHSSVRSAGIEVFADVEAVVLETDGKFSEVRGRQGSGASSLVGVNTPDLN